MSDRPPESPRDGFRGSREGQGVFLHHAQGDAIPLIVRHREVRAAAKDWERFSSDAPFQVPIPSEEAVRSVRQIPIELDPPRHGAYRKLIEPWFLRPIKPAYQRRITALVHDLVGQARSTGTVDVLTELALPLQCRALAVLLNVPQSEADRWIGWGNSLFREGDGVAKGAELNAYLAEQFAFAREHPDSGSFFAFLTQLELGRRELSDDELSGIANLVFAGGRDTVINSIAETIAYLAFKPADFDSVRGDPRLINRAVEELVRYVSPLSFIGRVCPRATEVGGTQVEPDGRIGLCWASANYDSDVFESPHEVRLDRAPNPHMGFGSGRHACLGAAHARTLLRSLVTVLAEVQARLTIVDSRPAFEDFGSAQRRLGYTNLVVKFGPVRP